MAAATGPFALPFVRLKVKLLDIRPSPPNPTVGVFVDSAAPRPVSLVPAVAATVEASCFCTQHKCVKMKKKGKNKFSTLIVCKIHHDFSGTIENNNGRKTGLSDDGDFFPK